MVTLTGNNRRYVIWIPVRNCVWSDAIILSPAWSVRLTYLIKRSFSIAGHRTSVALEEEFWEVLLDMARARGQKLSALIATADSSRTGDRPLTSALRTMALAANRGGFVAEAKD
jgi:predicted DNA-binding ribbon-helix-helix protein